MYDVASDSAPSTLEAQLLSTTGGSGTIEVKDSDIFQTFEGQPVSASNIGYVKIGDEIIGYSTATINSIDYSILEELKELLKIMILVIK